MQIARLARLSGHHSAKILRSSSCFALNSFQRKKLVSRQAGSVVKNSFRSFQSTTVSRANIFYDTEESRAVIDKAAPNFTAKAIIDGEIKTVKLEDYRGKWSVLLFYPMDFTFVCPTEIISFSDQHFKFEAINAQVLAISTDTEFSHLAWTNVPRERGGLGHMDIPLLEDTTKSISADYGVLIEDKGIALRGLFIIDPDGILQHITINGLSVGRSVDETLRLIQAYQYVKEHGEVCPANWKPGDKAMKTDDVGSQEYFSTMMSSKGENMMEPSEKVFVIKSPQDYKDAIAKPKTVVDFVAPYCGKCKQLMPFVNQLSEEFPGITFAKFDTTDESITKLSSDLGVKDIPSFHFFKNSKPYCDPITGYKKRSLKAMVEQLAKE